LMYSSTTFKNFLTISSRLLTSCPGQFIFLEIGKKCRLLTHIAAVQLI
uniref:Ovule protein n=1 Tax=Haemonchus placei TaxID=6290 RepID=A0A0N4XAJ4_HAEPC